MSFTLYEIETAPEAAKAELTQSQKAFGFIPNLHKVMAEAPAVLEAYKYLHTQFQQTSFNATELTVVWQTINYYHECHYCIPAHTGIAHSMNIDAKIISDLHEGKSLEDAKLSALQATTRAIVDQRGHLTEVQKQVFFDAGYGNAQLLEITLGLAQKVMSNFANHFANTPIDKQFEQFSK